MGAKIMETLLILTPAILLLAVAIWVSS